MSELLSGLVQGFAQSQKDRLAQEENDEIRKLRVKMFQRQLDMENEAKTAQSALLDLLAPTGIPMQDHEGGGSGPAQLPGRSLTQVLASPEGQRLALQSGVKITDLLGATRPGLPEMLAGGQMQGALGGMELSGVKVGPRGEVMPDFTRPKFKGEFPSPDGSMIRYDEFGREMSRRPMAPSERKPPEQTQGQTQADKKFAEEYVEFKASGGYADVQKQLTQLRGVSKNLETQSLTGPVIGNVPERALKVMNPNAIAARDMVFDTAQRNLRLILGPQFTAKEGEALLGRAYDIALPPAENKKRVDRLITQIETAARAKQEAIDYFEKKGTLTGFKGKLWTLADFMNDTKPSLKGLGKNSDPLGIR